MVAVFVVYLANATMANEVNLSTAVYMSSELCLLHFEYDLMRFCKISIVDFTRCCQYI